MLWHLRSTKRPPGDESRTVDAPAPDRAGAAQGVFGFGAPVVHGRREGRSPAHAGTRPEGSMIAPSAASPVPPDAVTSAVAGPGASRV
jgi:hypothetical protein